MHISATTNESLQRAIDKVNELMNIDMGSLVEDKSSRLREKVRLRNHLVINHVIDVTNSVNGQKKRSPWDSIPSGTSTSERKLSVLRYVRE